jgi:flagellin-like protein
MKKGITPIIAVIILLLITVALAGMAWAFLQGYFGSLTTKNIIAAGGYCTGGTQANVIIKNTGTDKINISYCDTGLPSTNTRACGELTVARTDTGGSGNMSLGTGAGVQFLNGGATVIFTDTACTATGAPKSCSYIFTAGSGIGPATASVDCQG